MCARALVCVLASVGLALAGCGGDRPKTSTSCDGDGECSAGLCYDGQCFTSCGASADPCAAGSMCVGKSREDGEHPVCVAAAAITCTQDSDCGVVYLPRCRFPLCDPDRQACVLAEQPDSMYCEFAVALPAPVVAATGDTAIPGACFHGACHRKCVEDGDCADGAQCVLQLNPATDESSFCAVEALLACHATGFEGEWGDYCSSVFANTEKKTCQYVFVPADKNPAATGCEGTDPVCLTEGCSTSCKADADCGGKQCVAFAKPSAAEGGWDAPILYKACR